MKNSLIAITVALLLGSVFSSCAQTTCAVKKIYAFSMERVAGNIPVDPNTRVPLRSASTIFYTIYIETKGTVLPQWDSVQIGNTRFDVLVTEVTDRPFTLGRPGSASNGNYTIHPGKGNRLWQLELQFAGETQKKRLSASGLILEGRCGRRKITQVVDNIIKLAPEFMP